MKHTANYQLNQWEPGDRILRTNFNEDNSKTDAAIHTVQTDLATETAARTAAVNAEISARTAAVTAETSARTAAVNAEISARTAAVNAETSARTAAVAALDAKMGMKLLRTITSDQATQVMDMMLGPIEWSKYRYIHLEILSQQNANVAVNIYFNSNPSYPLGTAFFDSAHVNAPIWCTFFPIFSDTQYASLLCMGANGGNFHTLPLHYSEISSLQFAPQNSVMKPGTMIRIYGEL